MNENYRWDPAEGIIGVVGVAPAATADFYRRITSLTPARKDWEHVRVLIDSNPKLPSRGRHLELGETDPSPYIAECIAALCERGATVVAVPCNTAHVLYDRYAGRFGSTIVPHMIDTAIEALTMRQMSPPRRLAVLGSRHTVGHDLYGKRLRPRGGACLDVWPWQTRVSALIEHVKQGRDMTEAARLLRELMTECLVAGADGFAIACTELSSIVETRWVDVPVVDSNETLASHCLATAKRAVTRAA